MLNNSQGAAGARGGDERGGHEAARLLGPANAGSAAQRSVPPAHVKDDPRLTVRAAETALGTRTGVRDDWLHSQLARAVQRLQDATTASELKR